MVGQSHAPQLLLTRPLAQSRRFVRNLRTEWGGGIEVTVSPLMAAVFLTPDLPNIPYQGLIFSSETAVAAYRSLRRLQVSRAFCVGLRTAEAARGAGLLVIAVAEDAAGLIAKIVDSGAAGPLLHLRGEDSRGDVTGNLRAAGIAADHVVIYRQAPRPLTQTARRLLAGQRPVILPLFSPRSAVLFGAAAQSAAPLHIIALSGAVAAEIPPHLQARIVIAKSPTGSAMVRAAIDLLMEPPFA